MFVEVHIVSPHCMENTDVKDVTPECFDLTFCGSCVKTNFSYN